MFNTTLVQQATISLTLPAVSGLTVATLTGTETLTNKTINLTSNTLSGTTAQFNAALSDDDFATLTNAVTLTNKTINLTSNTLSGTTAQFNTALSDDDFATLTNAVTLTNKTLTAPVINGTVTGTMAITPTGASLARTLASRFSDVVNVKDYGALGDNATNDNAAIASAITVALASGADVYWPVGTYITTTSLASFHSVNHRGPGIVKANGTSFRVEPKDGVTNVLFVTTTGNDANDGLSSTNPFLTPQHGCDVILGYPYGDVTWQVVIAAGTYSGNVISQSIPFPATQRVQFLGSRTTTARVLTDGQVPTTLFASSANGQNGILFQTYLRAQIEDIKTQNYTTSGTPSIAGTGLGFLASTMCDIYMVNFHSAGNDIGVKFAEQTTARVHSGIISGNATGAIAIDHCTVTWGYQNTAADITGVTGVAVISNTVIAMNISESSDCHTDYCYLDGNTVSCTGLYITTKSHVHSLGCTFARFAGGSGTGVKLEANSTWLDNTVTVNTFTANTINVDTKTGAQQTAADDGMFNPGQRAINTTLNPTSAIAAATVFTRTFGARELAIRGAGVKLQLWFTYVGVTSTKNITVTFGATSLLNLNVAAGTTSALVEVTLFNVTAASAQKSMVRVQENGVQPTVAFNVLVAENVASGALVLAVTHNVANVADTSRFQLSDFQMWH